MKPVPELSVVIRGGDINDWLCKTVESTLNSQGLNLEIILVLNSPDVPLKGEALESQERAYSWLQDPRLTVLRYDRYIGVSNAMRVGCENARADFIANVDGDDLVDSTKFRTQLDYLATHPQCVLVGTGGRLIDGTGQVTGHFKIPLGDDVRRSMLLLNPIPHSSIVMRAQAYKEVGGYRQDLEQFEDYDLFLRLARLGAVATLPGPGISYRVHSENISKGAGSRGRHIKVVAQGRRQLAKVLGVPQFLALPQHFIWRAVQFIRVAGLIRPLHEYFKFL
ncbi:glycosyltransferase [Rothia sp. P5766]|uniref:glycosyltransferase n=1 Tax=Rothia sp. P5766 TaxID=3402656 RepID=UPI003AE9F924